MPNIQELSNILTVFLRVPMLVNICPCTHASKNYVFLILSNHIKFFWSQIPITFHKLFNQLI